MTLDKMIENLLKLQAEGHGNKTVFYRIGSSGDCGELGYASITNRTDECGPFDLEDEEEYVQIYGGH